MYKLENPEQQEREEFIKYASGWGYNQPLAKANTTKSKSWKRWLVVRVIMLIITLGVMIYGLFIINNWFNEHTFEFQSPVKFYNPIRVKNRVLPEVSVRYDIVPEANAMGNTELSTAPREVSAVVSVIYTLESSGGKNDPCRSKGLYNGYGYAPGTCYASHEEVTSLVSQWFHKNIAKYGVGKAVCGYNLGFNHAHLLDCVNQSSSYPYYRNFLALNSR